jgi:flagellar biosynthetic protein FliR
MPEIIDRLNALIAGNVYLVLLVFARIGTALMLMPGFGSTYTPARIRLLLALGLSLVIAPVVKSSLPAEPPSAFGLAGAIGIEAVIGAFLGTVALIMMSSLETGGLFIAQQMGLSNSYIFSPQTQTQESLPGTLLSLGGVVLLFVTDMHHMLISSLVDSYQIFRFDDVFAIGDMPSSIIKLVSQSFLIGFNIATPFIVVGLLLFVSFGLIARLMPQVQIFFITLPLQTGLGMIVFAACMPLMMRYWMAAFQNAFLTLGLGEQ